MNFFIAVFFVSLGVRMELGAVAGQWLAATAFSILVLGGKFALICGFLVFLRQSPRTAFLTAATLTQISEFSFLVAALGFESGLIAEETLSLIALIGLITFGVNTFVITHADRLYDWCSRRGLLGILGARRQEAKAPESAGLTGHIIVVGMNTLGRELVKRLVASGERVLAIDTDPSKLAGLPSEILLGNAETLSLLREAGLSQAKLLVSALHIEPTNDLLAYHCHRAGIPCSVHVVDLSVVDNLLEMDVTYLMVPNVDGVKLQNEQLTEMGFLKS